MSAIEALLGVSAGVIDPDSLVDDLDEEFEVPTTVMPVRRQVAAAAALPPAQPRRRAQALPAPPATGLHRMPRARPPVRSRSRAAPPPVPDAPRTPVSLLRASDLPDIPAPSSAPSPSPSSRPGPKLPGLPGLQEARKFRVGRASSVHTMATLSPRAPVAQATDAAAAPASPGRSPLLALFACILLTAGLFVGLAVAAITGFAATTGTASAALLLACGTGGALAAGLSAVAVRALRIRRSILSAVAIGSAGGIGFAFGWLLRLTVPGGQSSTTLLTAGSTPEPLLAAIESNLLYARLELVTPALSGVWVAELLLTLSAIAAAVRWVDSRSV